MSVELQIMFVISNSINVYCPKKQIIITLANCIYGLRLKTCGSNVNGQLNGCNVHLTFGGVMITPTRNKANPLSIIFVENLQ